MNYRLLLIFWIFGAVIARPRKIDDLSRESRCDILKHLNFAAAAYDNYPLETFTRRGYTVTEVPCDISLLGFSKTTFNLRIFENPGQNEFVVGVPGTVGLKDWANNFLQSTGKASILGCNQIQVHKGFFEQGLVMYGNIKDQLVNRAEQGYKIFFDGHSRGGPVASFMMAAFADEYPQYAHQCYLYTFNSALGGGPQWVDAFNEQFPGQAFNIYDGKDIVRQLGIPGSDIPGEQLQVVEQEAVTAQANPHKIGSLMSKMIMSHLQDDPVGTSALLPQDEGFLNELFIIGDLNNEDQAMGDLVGKLSDLVLDNENGEDLYLLILPGMPNSVENGPKQDIYLMMSTASREAFFGAGAQFVEELAVVVIDGDMKDHRALWRGVSAAIQAGASIYCSDYLSQEIMARVDLSGLTVLERNDVHRSIGNLTSMAVGVIVRLFHGDFKGALNSVIYGSISFAASQILDTTVSFGPSFDYCSKGKFAVAKTCLIFSCRNL